MSRSRNRRTQGGRRLPTDARSVQDYRLATLCLLIGGTAVPAAVIAALAGAAPTVVPSLVGVSVSAFGAAVKLARRH